MTSIIGRGLAAGAVGTTLLNLASYLDMLLTDRDPSSAPTDTALAAADAVGLPVPGGHNRPDAFGALAGIGAGLAVGVGASAVRAAGIRLPAPLGAAAVGAAAMAATDVPMARYGVSDPASWTAADWARDIVPHLAYGVGVRYVLDRFHDTSPDGTAPAGRLTAGLVVRSVLIGVASGARSSLGPLAAAISGGRSRATVVTSGLAVAELVGDKLPQAPSRLEVPGLAFRALAGAVGGAALARHDRAPVVVPALAGVAGAGLGSIAGAAWREICEDNDWGWQGALVEDAVGLALTAVAIRR